MRYEYKLLDCSQVIDFDALVVTLNEAGNEGWEMITFDGYIRDRVMLKRAIGVTK